MTVGAPDHFGGLQGSQIFYKLLEAKGVEYLCESNTGGHFRDRPSDPHADRGIIALRPQLDTREQRLFHSSMVYSKVKPFASSYLVMNRVLGTWPRGTHPRLGNQE